MKAIEPGENTHRPPYATLWQSRNQLLWQMAMLTLLKGFSYREVHLLKQFITLPFCPMISQNPPFCHLNSFVQILFSETIEICPFNYVTDFQIFEHSYLFHLNSFFPRLNMLQSSLFPHCFFFHFLSGHIPVCSHSF